MALALFLLQAGAVSLSGVMMPGPLSAVAVAKGSRSPFAGLLVSVGHAVVEFAIMLALFVGAQRLAESTLVKAIIALAGAVLLALMALDMVRADGSDGPERGASRSPVTAGIALSAGNPYFALWWLTVGAALMLQATRFGAIGFVLFVAVHWACDFAWCFLLSALSYHGGRTLGPRFRRAVMVVCGLFLFAIAAKFAFDGSAALAA